MTPMAWLLFALMTSVKALLVMTAAFGLTRLMRNRSASERHLVWMLASICVLALPVLSLATPWRIGMPAIGWNAEHQRHLEEVHVEVAPAPASHAPRAEHISSALGAPALLPAATRVRPTPATAAVAPAPPAVPVRPARAAAVPAPARVDVEIPPAPDRSGMTLLLLVIWATGTLLVLARTGAGFVQLHRLTRRAQPLLDPVLLVRMHGIAAQMGVERPVRVLEGDMNAMPITFGITRATLLLPSSARTWTAARQDSVLRHELAHIRRRDSLSQLIVELGCALYWFNPLMWWASREMCVEREHACDDAVLASGSRASDYAAELLDIARTLRAQPGTTLAAIAMARQSHLRTRVASLLDPRTRYERASMRLLVPAWIGAFLLITPLSSVAPEIGGRIPADPTPVEVPAPEARTVRSAPVAPATAEHGDRAHGYADDPGAFGGSCTTTPACGKKDERASAADGASPFPAEGPLPRSSVWPATEAAAAAFQAEAVASAALRRTAHAGVGALFSPQGSPALQDDCLSGGRNTSINHNSNDDRQIIKWSGRDCSGEVVVEGDLQFDAAFTNIVGISRGGQFRVTTEEGRTERRVTITPAGNGVAYDYRVNGDRRELDAAGREWLSSTMLFLFRRLGFMAEERASAILQRGGTSAVLAEVEQLHSDHARSRYLATLIERGRLDEASLNRVLTLAGNTIESDHYRTQIITAVAGRSEFTDGVRTAYIDAISGMDSDHYRHVAFSTLLKKGRLTAPQVSAVLSETQRIDSDHYRAQLLDEMADSYSSNPAIRAAYLEAAESIDSDHYKSNVLTRLFTLGGMSDAEAARVVDAAGTIESDHYRSEILTRVARNGLQGAALQRAFMRAATGIESDHYLQSVLSQLAARDDLDNGTLLAMLEAAGSIGSDHYQSELLVQIAKRHRLQGEVRTRFERLVQEMGSDTYRGRVAAALLRNGG